MTRLLTTSAALGILLAMTGAALAQGVANAPVYYNPAPPYGQQMVPPPPPASGPAQAWVSTPGANEPHSSGSSDRAYPGGLKTN